MVAYFLGAILYIVCREHTSRRCKLVNSDTCLLTVKFLQVMTSITMSKLRSGRWNGRSVQA